MPAPSRPLRAPIALAIAATAVVPTPARAGGEPAEAYADIAKGRAVDLRAMIDTYVQRSIAGTPADEGRFRAFDTREPFAVNFARVTVAHAPSPLGFRLDLGAGTTADAFLRSDPASARYPDPSRALSYVAQAFVSANVPIGRGVAVDAGKFATPIGLEDNESLANWCYSRSLLFTLGEPTYHSGMRATYAASDALAASVFWMNGWNANVLEGTGMRSFAGSVAWTPSDRVEASVVYAGGLEHPVADPTRPTLAFRHEVDGSVVYAPSDAIRFAASALYARDEDARSFWGAAAYAHWRAASWLSATARGEVFADSEGVATGAPQRIVEATLTLDARREFGDLLGVLRLELRRDRSDAEVFGDAKTSHDTVTLAAIVAY